MRLLVKYIVLLILFKNSYVFDNDLFLKIGIKLQS